VATSAVPTGMDLASLTAQVAGDLDGDAVQDLLVTANVNGTVGAGGAYGPMPMSSTWGRSAFASPGNASGEPDSVTAVSGASGQTLYAGSADSGSALEFESDAGPAAQDAEEDDDGNGIPSAGLLPALLALAVAAGVALRRRRD
jgi:MYXO-CTERM domain-containing protein